MKPFSFLCFVLLALAFSQISMAQKRMVILGDSLTEGYGVAKEQAYPALLDKKIKADGKNWVVINAGVSGSTTASGPSRLQWLLKNKIDLLIIALGANDGLRGIPVEASKKNLAQTIELAQKNNVSVVLVGMKLPPNYGKIYDQKFQKMYVELAEKFKVRRVPFLLEKVGGEPSLNQPDGLHPNEKGHVILAETMYAAIKDLL